MPAYPGNLRTSPLGDVLAWCAQQPLADVRAMLQQLADETGLPVPATMLIAGGTQGPDAVGDQISGNPVLLGADSVGAVSRVKADGAGNLIAMTGQDDALTTPKALLTDRARILAVAPPVSKLWTISAAPNAAGAGAVQNGPAAGLRNVILSWGVSISCGATPQPTIDLGCAVNPLLPFGSPYPWVKMACPANDSRAFAGEGPVIFPPATNATVGIGAAPAAGVQITVWAVGYVAAFP
jgi:hypothetical protein